MSSFNDLSRDPHIEERADIIMKRWEFDKFDTYDRGNVREAIEQILSGQEKTPEYEPGPRENHLQLLRNFVTNFADGEQGCMMEWDAVQALALAIQQALAASDSFYRALFLMKHGREPTKKEMGL